MARPRGVGAEAGCPRGGLQPGTFRGEPCLPGVPGRPTHQGRASLQPGAQRWAHTSCTFQNEAAFTSRFPPQRSGGNTNEAAGQRTCA